MAERKRIGDLLVDAGMITAEQLQDTLANKKAWTEAW